MDAATPLVSVIMSVRNGEQWLSEAIESIRRQTYPSWEFIIIDDASDQATRRIIQQYADDSRFKIITRQTQQGLTKNLNTAIDNAKGEFIARMDADDISLPERLQSQVAYLQQHKNVDAVAGFIQFIDENGKTTGNWKDDIDTISWPKIKSVLPWRNCIAHPSILLRSETLKKFRYRDEQIHSQDWDLWLRMADAGKVIEKINTPVLLYRVHPQSVTSSTNKKSAFLKKHEFYKRYLNGRRSSSFNNKVRLGFMFNRIKLFLSSVKRRLTS